MEPAFPTDSELDFLRRQLRFRSWHRGTKEADMMLGTFADAHLDSMTPDQLERYGVLLEAHDPDIYNWAMGREPVPTAYDTDVMAMLKRHDVSKHLQV